MLSLIARIIPDGSVRQFRPRRVSKVRPCTALKI